MTRKLALSLVVASAAALDVFTARVHAIDDPGSRFNFRSGRHHAVRDNPAQPRYVAQ